jgi:hypothetical protein
MAYVNGEFKNEFHEIKIEVLEPTKEENNYAEGMKIDVDWDSFTDLSMKEFREVIKWMSEQADYIEKNFTKKGKKK